MYRKKTVAGSGANAWIYNTVYICTLLHVENSSEQSINADCNTYRINGHAEMNANAYISFLAEAVLPSTLYVS
jgi:hypothetical protein